MRPTSHYAARGVVERGYKYLRYEPSGIEQLFDVTNDPVEMHNLAGSRMELRARLSRMLDDRGPQVR